MAQEFLTLTASANIDTPYGSFVMDAFALGGCETLVLRTEDIGGKEHGVLCRIQSECVSHVFSDDSCDCADQIASSLRRIQEAKSGLLIYLRQEGMGLGIAGKLSGDNRDWRTYFVVLEVLRHYGISSVDAISLNKAKIAALRKGGITVGSYSGHEGVVIRLGKRIRRLVEQVHKDEAYRPVGQSGKPRVFIAGDLNIDLISLRKPVVAVGGTAYHAALALKNSGEFVPIVFGNVGRDDYGSMILEALRASGIWALVGEHPQCKTGVVEVTPTGDSSLPFQSVWEKRNNANDYDENNLRQAVELAGLGKDDYIFLVSYLFVQKLFSAAAINPVIRRLSDSGARLILDITRKSLAMDVLQDCGIAQVDGSMLKSFIAGVKFHGVIGDMSTFDYLGLIRGKRVPDPEVFRELSDFFSTRWVVCRYVQGGNVHQMVAFCPASQIVIVADENTGSPVRVAEIRIGFPEEMFASALAAIDRYEQINVVRN